ncbi:MAG TPA: alpha/beta fold hydrolase [Vicinamibacterales bacterium]|nr:alpha/beta fold hydrolase [Vicinamibacterales bacterium]
MDDANPPRWAARLLVATLVVVPLTGVVIGQAHIDGWAPPGGSATPQLPAAVIADPPSDKAFPAALAIVSIPSHGVALDATLYQASGQGPHGAVVLLHGLPGYEVNGDLAQAIRRAGWHVLLFHYRGMWGAGGAFSLSSAIEDTAQAVRFLRDAANAARYRVDPRRVVLIGHSFGGFLAGFEGSRNADIAGIAMLSAVNLGTLNDNPRERDSRLARWSTQLHPVPGVTASALFAEAARHGADWDYRRWAGRLRDRPVLIVTADDQNRADMDGLAAALRKESAAALQHHALQTDHSFSDRRIALQAILVRWLESLTSATTRAKNRAAQRR